MGHSQLMKTVYVYDFRRKNNTYKRVFIWLFFFNLPDNPVYAPNTELTHLF